MTDKRKGLFTEFQAMQAWLSTEFGKNLALNKLGLTEQKLEALIGRYKTGKRAGLLRGQIMWFKVPYGGWSRELGKIVPPCSFGYTICDYDQRSIFPNRAFGEKYAAALYREHCVAVQEEKISKYLLEHGVQLENPLVQIIGDYREFDFSIESLQELIEKDREITRSKNKTNFKKQHSALCSALEAEIGFFLNALKFVPVWEKLTKEKKSLFSQRVDDLLLKYDVYYEAALKLDPDKISDLVSELSDLKNEMLAASNEKK